MNMHVMRLPPRPRPPRRPPPEGAVQYVGGEIGELPTFSDLPEWFTRVVRDGRVTMQARTEDYYYLRLRNPDGVVVEVTPSEWLWLDGDTIRVHAE